MWTDTHKCAPPCLWNDTLFCSHWSFLYSVRGWGTKGLKLTWAIKPHIFFLLSECVFCHLQQGETDRVHMGGGGGVPSQAGCGLQEGGLLTGARGSKTTPVTVWRANPEVQSYVGYDWWHYVLKQDLNASTLLWFNPPSSNIQAQQMDCTAPSLSFPEAILVKTTITNQLLEAATAEQRR